MRAVIALERDSASQRPSPTLRRSSLPPIIRRDLPPRGGFPLEELVGVGVGLEPREGSLDQLVDAVARLAFLHGLGADFLSADPGQRGGAVGVDGMVERSLGQVGQGVDDGQELAQVVRPVGERALPEGDRLVAQPDAAVVRVAGLHVPRRVDAEAIRDRFADPGEVFFGEATDESAGSR